ncbi:MAG: hypothetical protein H6Q14_1189 [Bacteroidetes bacterium]|jgi:hypothetical protein|nr:hypothetical protein [Bacteroidota bacterium]
MHCDLIKHKNIKKIKECNFWFCIKLVILTISTEFVGNLK